ncbi:unnamed protein product [Spirodela intermedia]|uniref:Uncharacterized protein n=2 Tax=Spirodela intermedia TaxID=51605 RepID=A0A7I8ITE8_SPIIN|nr:unnamed protein product [Spirodela intermedia]CAA6661292.1 unnamed protein product [Spirodela intermedia]CAA7397659.1 unnamed protein product [Spirodela intermedia]
MRSPERRRTPLRWVVMVAAMWAVQLLLWVQLSAHQAVAIEANALTQAAERQLYKEKLVFPGKQPSPLDLRGAGRGSESPPPRSPTAPKHLGESKRRVPSCPNPLHNR